MPTTEQLAALTDADLKRVYADAMWSCFAKGVQTPAKRKPRILWMKKVAAEVDRRRAK